MLWDEGQVKEGVCWQQPARLPVWLMSDAATLLSFYSPLTLWGFHLPHHWQWKTIFKPGGEGEKLILMKAASGQRSFGQELIDTNPTQAVCLCQAIPPSQSEWNLNGREWKGPRAAKSCRLTSFLRWDVLSSKQNNTGNLKQHITGRGRNKTFQRWKR